ncbi:MAG: cell division protein ZapA [Proteobacteria bacterium]|nr:cell division protein ZapA [Pseudomonadota bacterium]
MEQLVTIELFGQPYTFKTESGVINAQEVADYLVKEVNKIQTQHSNKSSHVTKLATMILAALNIANENMKLKENHLDLLKDISERSADLIRGLDAATNNKKFISS